MNTDSAPARKTDEGIIVAVRLTPKAAKDELLSIEQTADGPVLKARVRAVPDKGKANEAIQILLARWLDVPKSRAELVSGGKSRLKQILIKGTPQALMDKFAECAVALKQDF